VADNWESLVAADLVPGFVPTIASSVAGTMSAISTILGAAATLMGTVKTFLIDVTDPMAAVVNTVISQIESEINDFYNTGCYVTYRIPKTRGDRAGIQGTLRSICNSFENERDPARPQFGPSESVGAYVILAGAPDLVAIVNPANLLKLITNIKEIEAFLDLDNPVYKPEHTPWPNGAGTVTNFSDGKNPREYFVDLARVEQVNRFSGWRIEFLSGLNDGLTTGIVNFDPTTREFQIAPLPRNLAAGDLYQLIQPQSGRQPFWYSKRIAEVFPALGEIFAIMAALTRQLAAGLGVVQAATEFIAALERKATRLQDISDDLTDKINDLQAALSGGPLYILRLPPETGGNAALTERILAAGNAPDWPQGTYYVLAAIMVADDTTYPVLELIYG